MMIAVIVILAMGYGLVTFIDGLLLLGAVFIELIRWLVGRD